MPSTLPSDEFSRMYNYMSRPELANIQFLQSYVQEVLQPLTQLPSSHFSTILDLAAGRGETSSALASIFPQAKIFTSDLNPDAMNVALTADQRLHALIASAEKLPIVDLSVDLAHCKDALAHILDRKLFFAEIYRVLKHGGYCVIAFSEVKNNVYQQQAFSRIRTQRMFNSVDQYIQVVNMVQEINQQQKFQIKIGPPFFKTQATELKMDVHPGLVLVQESTWQPQSLELPKDWYQKMDDDGNLVAVPRLIWILQKT